MHVLFVHPNFPAQFRYLAPRLARDYGWKCTFVTRNAKAPDVPGVERVLYRRPGGEGPANHPCTRYFERAVREAHGVYEAMKARPDVRRPVWPKGPWNPAGLARRTRGPSLRSG